MRVSLCTILDLFDRLVTSYVLPIARLRDLDKVAKSRFRVPNITEYQAS